MSQQAIRWWNKLSDAGLVDRGLASVRALYGLYWLYSASWKVPPDFGQATNTGLWFWISQGIQHPAFDWYRSFLEQVIVPNFELFGYLVLVTELFIGLSIFLGAFTRLGAAVGIVMSINIMLSVVGVPGEAAWFYVALIVLHALFGITRSGRTWGLDAVLSRRLASAAASGNRLAARLLQLT